jgi:putative membrane protein
MDKNELCKKVSAGMLLVTMSLYATPVFAYSKDETVYSKLNSEGNSYKTIVSTHLKNTDSENTLNDMTNLTNIKNTNGDEKFSQNGNSLIWDAQKHDIYYQGESENELPISCSVKYELDGEEISAKDIAGKSGKVKVTINYENKSENLVNINGKTQKLYHHLLLLQEQ